LHEVEDQKNAEKKKKKKKNKKKKSLAKDAESQNQDPNVRNIKDGVCPNTQSTINEKDATAPK
jgi:hypothetical protein